MAAIGGIGTASNKTGACADSTVVIGLKHLDSFGNKKLSGV